MIVGNKTFPMSIDGMKKAEELARRNNLPIQADQSVYGPTNANPMMNPDSNTMLTQERDTSLRRKNPRPYKTNMKL